MTDQPASDPPIADLIVADLLATATGSTSRVSVEVDGSSLWFETRDAVLTPSPEAIASALLPVAVAGRRRLVFECPLDREWRDNVADLLAVWHQWWGTDPRPGAVIRAPMAYPPRSMPKTAVSRIRRRPRVALGFSLGVDSFYSLLRSRERIDRLVLVEGFDIGLDDVVAMDAARAALHEVASATGTEPVIVRTNLRSHPVSDGTHWPNTHGGALAALGHLSGPTVRRLLISATKPRGDPAPWGSHWSTDHLFSSSRVSIVHVGAERRRHEKLAALVDEPLVRRHLRVCFSNPRAAGNCGVCEKCVRTMLVLSIHDVLDAFTTFPPGRSLVEALDELPGVTEPVMPVYAALRSEIRDPRMRASVDRLLGRSPLGR